jgi:CRP-like cAMP-binding protein
MPDVVYEIVQHDGGWAYKVNGVFSEPFLTHAEALAAAQVAAAELGLTHEAFYRTLAEMAADGEIERRKGAIRLLKSANP